MNRLAFTLALVLVVIAAAGVAVSPAASRSSAGEPGTMRAAYATDYGRVTLVGNYTPGVRHFISQRLRLRIVRKGAAPITLALGFRTIGPMAPSYWGAPFEEARPWFFVSGRHVIFSAALHSGVQDLPFEMPAPVGDTRRYGLRVTNIYRVILRGGKPARVALVAHYTAPTPFPASAFEPTG